MKRVGFMMIIDQEKIGEYKKFHEDVWPEMKAALTRTGWHNYTLFIKPDGVVFGYVETPEGLEKASALMKLEEINTKWQTTMSGFTPNGMKPDETFFEMEEYFHLD